MTRPAGRAAAGRALKRSSDALVVLAVVLLVAGLVAGLVVLDALAGLALVAAVCATVALRRRRKAPAPLPAR